MSGALVAILDDEPQIRTLLSDASRAALEKERGITLVEALELYFELLSWGYRAPFDRHQKRKAIPENLKTASVEDLDLRHPRGLDKRLVRSLIGELQQIVYQTSVLSVAEQREFEKPLTLADVPDAPLDAVYALLYNAQRAVESRDSARGRSPPGERARGACARDLLPGEPGVRVAVRGAAVRGVSGAAPRLLGAGRRGLQAPEPAVSRLAAGIGWLRA